MVSVVTANERSVRLLAQSAVAVSHTGDTNETALATVTIPGGTMGANGILRITTLWAYTNSANQKTLRTRLGGVGGTIFQGTVPTTTAAFQNVTMIRNRGSESSQIGFYFGAGGAYSVNGNANTTGAVNTAQDQDLVIAGLLADSGETITLESYFVELLRA